MLNGNLIDAIITNNQSLSTIMKSLATVFFSLLLACCFLLSACGKKGPLFLPDPEAAVQPSTFDLAESHKNQHKKQSDDQTA